MTDTEKKIAEIREALEKATPGTWVAVDEIATVYSANADVVIEYSADEREEDIRLIANAPEWLRFLLSELERKDEVIEEQKRELFYKSKEITELREKSWQDQQWFKQASANITEMQKELDREREENRKLRGENSFQKKVIESYTRILHARAKDWERLFEEREMLIEGLRWYADEDTHMIKRRSDGDYAPIALDHGKRARDILHEIGVTEE